MQSYREPIDVDNISSSDSSPNSSGRAYSSDGTPISIHSVPTLFNENEITIVAEPRDDLLNSYYANFHPAHPCVLPRLFFNQRLEADHAGLKPILLVMQYIGSLYISSVPSASFEALVLEALAESRIVTPSSTGHQVQALILYSIAAYWCNEVGKGLSLLDEAISRAVSLGMNQKEFAAVHGGGDSVLEESWRRTWWLVCVTDAHFAGSTHTFPFRTTHIPMNADLPCEEESYASGVSLVFLAQA